MNFISDLNHYNLAYWLGFNGELRAPLTFSFVPFSRFVSISGFHTRVLSPQNNCGMANVSGRN